MEWIRNETDEYKVHNKKMKLMKSVYAFSKSGLIDDVSMLHNWEETCKEWICKPTLIANIKCVCCTPLKYNCMITNKYTGKNLYIGLTCSGWFHNKDELLYNIKISKKIINGFIVKIKNTKNPHVKQIVNKDTFNEIYKICDSNHINIKIIWKKVFDNGNVGYFVRYHKEGDMVKFKLKYGKLVFAKLK